MSGRCFCYYLRNFLFAFLDSGFGTSDLVLRSWYFAFRFRLSAGFGTSHSAFSFGTEELGLWYFPVSSGLTERCSVIIYDISGDIRQ